MANVVDQDWDMLFSNSGYVCSPIQTLRASEMFGGLQAIAAPKAGDDAC